MPDWRDEVCSALDFCIGAEGGAGQSERLVCIGPARQESRRGWYSVDLRDSRLAPTRSSRCEYRERMAREAARPIQSWKQRKSGR